MRTWKVIVGVAGALVIAGAGCTNGNEKTPARPDQTVSLPCGKAIESMDRPTGDRSVVFGRVELPTRNALGANRTNEDPGFPFFAKDGLVIKAGTSFDLIVPDAWRDHLRIGWGSPARPTAHLDVSRCPAIDPAKPWLAYAGGYFVKEPACVSLMVKVGKETRRVRIGVGAACPGQDLPPAPANP